MLFEICIKILHKFHRCSNYDLKTSNTDILLEYFLLDQYTNIEKTLVFIEWALLQQRDVLKENYNLTFILLPFYSTV